MRAPESPEPVPNPYAERPLDDDSAGALAALLFESAADGAPAMVDDPSRAAAADSSDAVMYGRGAATAGRPGPPTPHPGDAIGETALSREVTSTPVEGHPPTADPSTSLFRSDGDGAAAPHRPSAKQPLFEGSAPADPQRPTSLRWSTVVHEPTVAEMGATAGASPSGRRLFLEDDPSVATPPRVLSPPPDRYGSGSSAFAELIERRWHWFTVAAVAGLLIGFVTFTVRGRTSPDEAFPNVSAESGDDGSESVADTVPGGPALAANGDGGSTGSFKGATSSTSPPAATVPGRTGGVTTTVGVSTTSTNPTASTSDPSSTSSTASTTTRPSSTTARPSSTTRPTSTTGPTTTTVATTSTSEDTTTTTAGSSTTSESTTTTLDTTTTESTTSTPGPPPALPEVTSSSTTTQPDPDGILVVSEDPPSGTASTIF